MINYCVALITNLKNPNEQTARILDTYIVTGTTLVDKNIRCVIAKQQTLQIWINYVLVPSSVKESFEEDLSGEPTAAN